MSVVCCNPNREIGLTRSTQCLHVPVSVRRISRGREGDVPSRKSMVENDAFIATLAAVFHVLYVLYHVTPMTSTSPSTTDARVRMSTAQLQPIRRESAHVGRRGSRGERTREVELLRHAE